MGTALGHNMNNYKIGRFHVARRNAKTVLEFATVYPFRLPNDNMVCVYCGDEYDDPETYRQHMRDEHVTYNVDIAFAGYNFQYTEYLRVDCYEMACRICSEKLDNFELLASHLRNIHGKYLDLDVEIGLQMFKLGSERWVCALCPKKLPTIKELCRHTSVHYRKFTCETCGKSYINNINLQRHLQYGHSGTKICMKCRKEFPNCEAKREHMLSSEKCWPYVCVTCGERFMYSRLKIKHGIEVHGNSPKIHVCPDCGATFDKWSAYRSHFVLTHTNSYHACRVCGHKFEKKGSLIEHERIHTKERPFSCDVCDKTFATKHHLTQHSWMHKDQKRFACDLCNKQFNQRVSWKTHMKSNHPDLVTF